MIRLPLPASYWKEDEATRLGISNVMLETTLAMRYGSGIPVATVWEGDYDIFCQVEELPGGFGQQL